MAKHSLKTVFYIIKKAEDTYKTNAALTKNSIARRGDSLLTSVVSDLTKHLAKK